MQRTTPPKPSMKDRILKVADQLFYSRGIRATGVDTVSAEVGISKRTLYNHFPSKDALIAAYLERRSSPPEISDQPPAEQILAVFDRIERAIAGKGFRGCPFVNAVAEIGEPGHPANEIARAFKEERRLFFRKLLKRLDVENADRLATQLAILVDGAIATALVRGDAVMAREARSAASVLLRNAGVAIPAETPAHRDRHAGDRPGG